MKGCWGETDGNRRIKEGQPRALSWEKITAAGQHSSGVKTGNVRAAYGNGALSAALYLDTITRTGACENLATGRRNAIPGGGDGGFRRFAKRLGSRCDTSEKDQTASERCCWFKGVT